MSDIRLIGLESIKIGPSLASLVTVQHIVPDSAHIVLNAPSVADLFCEETEYPDIQIITAGKKTVEFATRDMGEEMFEDAFGGSHVSASGATLASWSAPTTAIVISERAFELVSKKINEKQLKFEIKRASLYAGGELRFAKTESGQITFTADVLLPTTGSPIVMTVQ
jgi:hypothetical protein